jgi:long-subunit acyl-CoA synthetase (AMP-forming)
MVGGETAEAIEASFAAAKALAGRLREGIAAEAARQVPAGAPGRARGAPLSAFEKIRQGTGGAARLTPCGGAATLPTGGK